MNEGRNVIKKSILSQREGEVEVRSYHSHSYNGATATHSRLVKPKWNPKKAWYEGVDKLSEEQKKTTTEIYVDPENPENTLSQVKLEHKKKFDLSNHADRLILKWLFECDRSLALNYEEGFNDPKVTFYVYNHKLQVNKRKKGYQIKDEAAEMLRNLSQDDLHKVSRLRGYEMANQNEEELRLFIRELFDDNKKGVENAKKFIETVEDRQSDIKDFILRAQRHRIIRKETYGKREEFYYGDSPETRVFLGATMASVISFLTEDSERNRMILLEIESEMGEPIPGKPSPSRTNATKTSTTKSTASKTTSSKKTTK